MLCCHPENEFGNYISSSRSRCSRCGCSSSGGGGISSSLHVYIYIHIYMCVYIWIYTYVYVYMYMYIYIYICICTGVCVWVYTTVWHRPTDPTTEIYTTRTTRKLTEWCPGYIGHPIRHPKVNGIVSPHPPPRSTHPSSQPPQVYNPCTCMSTYM